MMMPTASVQVENPLQEEVAALLQQSDLVAAQLYPGEYRRPITPESLVKAGTHLLVARLANKAVGMCAVFEHGNGDVELKRMIVDTQAQGQGVGAALIRGVQTEALRLGASVILLEVGTRNTEAQALYRRAGFTDRKAFHPYKPSPISLFMERRT